LRLGVLQVHEGVLLYEVDSGICGEALSGGLVQRDLEAVQGAAVDVTDVAAVGSGERPRLRGDRRPGHLARLEDDDITALDRLTDRGEQQPARWRCGHPGAGGRGQDSYHRHCRSSDAAK
jgi:hypothetical protein